MSLLLDTTRDWLRPLEEKQYLRIQDELISVREEALGEYEIKSLHVTFLTNRSISFRPIGTSVVGARGRVDVVSGGETVVMLVFRGDATWEFARRENRYGPPKTSPYNKDSLESFLAEYLEN